MNDRLVFRSDMDGKIRWQYSHFERRFVTLSLPKFFEKAPQPILDDVIEWCRDCVIADNQQKERPPMPDTVRDWKESPTIKSIRFGSNMDAWCRC